MKKLCLCVLLWVALMLAGCSDGNLYCESTASEGGETTDGKIPSIADGSEMSTENGQSNFGEESIINQQNPPHPTVALALLKQNRRNLKVPKL